MSFLQRLSKNLILQIITIFNSFISIFFHKNHGFIFMNLLGIILFNLVIKQSKIINRFRILFLFYLLLLLLLLLLLVLLLRKYFLAIWIIKVFFCQTDIQFL